MPDATRSQQPKLLDEVRKVLRLHHYSIHTMIYTQILQQGDQGIPSPLDDLGV